MEMIKFYQTVTEYLFSKLPLAKKKRSRKTWHHWIHCYLKLNVGFKLLYELSRVSPVAIGHQSRKNQPTDKRISGSSDARELVWFIQVSTN